MEIKNIGIGDELILKKPHPCSGDRFSVLRVGSDMRIRCIKCGKDLEIPREKLEKRIRLILKKNVQ